MEKTADEPRALSMSLDDIIKENRHKDGRSSQHRNNRGGAHFVANKSGGKQSYNSYNKGEKFVQPNRSVRVHYTWETAGGVETMSARVDDKELVRISSSGDVALRSAVEHDWAVFTPMNTVLAPVQLKLFFDKDIKKEWTVKNEAGWNRILDNDVTVSAFPSRQWGFIKRALEQLPESISLAPAAKHHAQPPGRVGRSFPMPLSLPGAGMMNPMMNPMMMMMMMAQQQAGIGAGGHPMKSPHEDAPHGSYGGGRGRGKGEFPAYGGRSGRGGRGGY